jgi:excisionase family DNA binding protein
MGWPRGANRTDVRALLDAVELPDEPTMTLAQLAKLLGVTFRTVDRALQEGRLPPRRQVTPRRSVFDTADLRAWQRPMGDDPSQGP